MYLLSCGFIGEYFASKNLNPKHIATIILKFLDNDWKFDYFETSCTEYKKTLYDYGIFNNGKTVKCDCHVDYCCYSLYRISLGMHPNSGIYDIKMKIDEINTKDRWSAIGI